VAQLLSLKQVSFTPPQLLFRPSPLVDVRKQEIPTGDPPIRLPQRQAANVEPAVNTVGAQDTVLHLEHIPGFY
jgi:hypothetical protein